MGPTAGLNVSKNMKIENEKISSGGNRSPDPPGRQLAHYSYCMNVGRITVCGTVDK